MEKARERRIMSRSYKQTPVCKDGNKSKKYGKRQAHKKIRSTALKEGGIL